MDNIQKVLHFHGLGMVAPLGQLSNENALKILKLKQFLKDEGLWSRAVCETGYEMLGIYDEQGYLIAKNSTGL